MVNMGIYKYILLSLAVAGILIVAVFFNNAYSYYTILRWICSPIFLYFALTSYRKNLEGWKWTFVVLGLLYNPIVPVHLIRSYWMIINLLTIILLSAWNYQMKKVPIIQRDTSMIK